MLISLPRLAALAALACSLQLSPAAALASEPAPGAVWVHPKLAAALAAAGSEERIAVRVVLEHRDLPASGARRRQLVAARQQRVLAALPAGAYELKYRHRSLSGFSAAMAPRALEALARHPEVVSIHPDELVYANLAQGAALIGADQVQAAGFTGDGVTVAVLDSGIDTDHPNLMDDLVAEYCACSTHPSRFGNCCPNGAFEQTGSGSAEDGDGHGTSVAGIITSSHATHTGVAPDAQIAAVKVLSDSGTGLDSGIDAGLDWVLTNHLSYGIRLVNMSLGDGSEQNDPGASDCSSDPTSVAIAALYAEGIATFVASGNEGYDDGISAPACTAEAISVGGVYDAVLGTIGWCEGTSCSSTCTDMTGPDAFVCHTNSDEILDLLAPNYRTATTDMGGGINSAFAGTSASSPYAAAQAALLLEADSSLGPEEIRGLLKSHGPLVTNPDNGLSFRRSDVLAALASLTCGNGVVDPAEACDPSAGSVCCAADCSFAGAGTPCDDGSLCTDPDACDGSGSCAGSAVVCDDGDVCTDDSCDPAAGCMTTANSAPCDDGDACTSGDVCSGGACTAGVPLVCDDGNACTDDSCDVLLGCAFTPNSDPCDDGNACTSGDACAAGSCTGGAPLVCDDLDLCTVDGCDAASGCVFTPDSAFCDDLDPCSADGCDALTGCFHTPIEGCAAPVPSGSTQGRALLLALLVLAGAWLAGARRRSA